jgi:hypothetical protein
MTDRLQHDFTLERFEAADIDPGRFDHAAHVYVGWLYVRAYPRPEAIARFDAALRRFTRKIGAADKYNAMITWLFLMLIAERSRDGEDWPAFRTRNSDLFDERPRAAAA